LRRRRRGRGWRRRRVMGRGYPRLVMLKEADLERFFILCG
jgi:hypothetical protein